MPKICEEIEKSAVLATLRLAINNLVFRLSNGWSDDPLQCKVTNMHLTEKKNQSLVSHEVVRLAYQF